MLLNKPRAEKLMRAAGLDVIIATSPVNITYFTDYHWWLDTQFKEYMVAAGSSNDLLKAYSVFPLNGAPALIIRPGMAANALGLWVRDVRFTSKPRLEEFPS